LTYPQWHRLLQSRLPVPGWSGNQSLWSGHCLYRGVTGQWFRSTYARWNMLLRSKLPVPGWLGDCSLWSGHCLYLEVIGQWFRSTYHTKTKILRPGLEPMTYRLTAERSTNWANREIWKRGTKLITFLVSFAGGFRWWGRVFLAPSSSVQLTQVLLSSRTRRLDTQSAYFSVSPYCSSSDLLILFLCFILYSVCSCSRSESITARSVVRPLFHLLENISRGTCRETDDWSIWVIDLSDRFDWSIWLIDLTDRFDWSIWWINLMLDLIDRLDWLIEMADRCEQI
jgi:hypothetical protein